MLGGRAGLYCRKREAVDTSLVEKAWDYVQRFKNWWDNLSLKSIMPNISVAGAIDGAKKFGGDLMDGIADGIGRAKSHISSMRSATEDLEDTARTTADTHSPSKVMAAVGADVVDGLAVGIDKNASKAAKAAKAAAEKVNDAFKNIMDGLNKQFIELTQGEEAARRFDLTQQKILGTNQDLVISTEAQIKALEDQRKKTDESKASAESAAKAYADLISGLKGQIVALSQGDEAGRRFELTQQKITGANQDAAISLQNQIKALEDQKAVREIWRGLMLKH